MELPHVTLAAVALVALASCNPPALPETDMQADATMNTPTADSARFSQLPVARDAEPRLTAAYARFRATQIANVEYSLNFLLPSRGPRFSGTSTVAFDLLRRDAAVTIDFKGGKVLGVSVNGSPLAIDYNGAWLSLPANVLNDGRNTVTIDFEHDYGRDGAGLQRFEDPEDGRVYLFSHFEPFDANRMFPCFDQPDLKATYSLRVTAPQDWQVISAVREREVVPLADSELSEPARRWTFAPGPRFSTYVFALHAGPYASWESSQGEVPLRLFARQSIAQYVDEDQWLGLTRDGLVFFNKWFGIELPYGKYDQIIVPGLNIGAMENVAAVTFNENYLSRGEQTDAEALALADVLLHEMSHMWFGNLVTMRWWDGLWLKESFATYMSHVAATAISPHTTIWQTFFARDKQRAYRADQRVTTHPIDVPVGDTRDAFAHFDSITYNKGASVLKQLAHYVGEAPFQDGVRRYLGKFAGHTTDLHDFVAALSASSGKALDAWARQWLNTAGVNTLRAHYRCEAGSLQQMSVQQTSPEAFPELRTHRVQVGLFALNEQGKVEALDSVPATISGAHTEVEFKAGTACPTMVYPNTGDWGFAKVALDEKTVDSLLRQIGLVGDPLQRAMFWQSLWDRVRDAELPLAQFLQLAERELATEADVTVTTLILDRVEEGVKMLKRALPASARTLEQLVSPLETLVWDRAAAASDTTTRMLWFDAYLDIAHTTSGLGRLTGATERLALDTRRQWKMVIVESGYGVPDSAARVELLAAADQSEFAQRRAMAARAAAPVAAIKSHWLAQLADAGASLDLAQARDVMAFLFPPHQTALSEQFADQVIRALPVLFEQRNDAFLRAYNRLLPRACTPANLRRLRQAIEHGTRLHPESLRALKEQHQEQQICAQVLNRDGIF